MRVTERRACAIFGHQVLLDPARQRLPVPWPRAGDEPITVPWDTLTPVATVDGVRVFANGRPALALEGAGDPGGFGANEVLLHHDGHASALRAAQARARDLRGDPRLRHFVWFHERGHARAAATHSQLLAATSPFPGAPKRPLADAASDAVDDERVVLQELDAVAFCPFAPTVPLETWVTGPGAGGLVDRVLARLDALLNGAPVTLDAHADWGVRLRPRVRPATGLELASGLHAHGMFPRVAADLLRRA